MFPCHDITTNSFLRKNSWVCKFGLGLYISNKLTYLLNTILLACYVSYVIGPDSLYCGKCGKV